MGKSLKDGILKLRGEGKSYNEIKKILNCSVGTISYHCSDGKKRDLNDGLVNSIKEYYNEGNSSIDTAEKFNVSKSTVLKYVDVRRRTKMTEEERKRKNVEGVIWYRKRLKERAVEYKGGMCECCGYDRAIEALEFHHRDPKEKDFSPSGKSVSWERMRKEIDKCVLVCANCHREIHCGLIEI
jgi:DNA-binding CsgD family transcriptional regulator